MGAAGLARTGTYLTWPCSNLSSTASAIKSAACPDLLGPSPSQSAPHHHDENEHGGPERKSAGRGWGWGGEGHPLTRSSGIGVSVFLHAAWHVPMVPGPARARPCIRA